MSAKIMESGIEQTNNLYTLETMLKYFNTLVGPGQNGIQDKNKPYLAN